MEIVKANMNKDLYFSLPKEVRDQIDIKAIEPDDFDYSDDERWQALKKKSIKAYKDLKEHEFNLRHNTKTE